jgi:hypothetical protein
VEPAGELLEDNPVMQRAATAISYMISKGNAAGGDRKPVMRIVSKIVREALVDASEVPPAIAEFYMKQLSAMIWWVACGEASPEVPLPEDFTV